MAALRTFGFRALDHAGRPTTGTVEGVDAEDAVHAVRGRALFALAIQAGGIPPAPPPTGAHLDGARQVVDLILLQVIQDNATEVVFTCTVQETSVRYNTGGKWRRMLPPPRGLSKPILECLRHLGNEPALGRGTASSRAKVAVGETFPDLGTRRWTFDFHSYRAQPGVVSLRPVRRARQGDRFAGLPKGGVYPTELTPGGLPAAPDAHPAAAEAKRALDLILLQAAADGATEVAFAFGDEGLRLEYEVTGQWRAMMPLPPESGERLLALLREITGQPDLARDSAYARVRLGLGRSVPGFKPFTVELEFETFAARRNVVKARFL